VGLRDRLFGKSTATHKPAVAPGPSGAPEREAGTDERIKRLWENARKLGWSDGEQKKAAEMYTELLTLVDEQSTDYNICAILRNRAIAQRSLKNYDAALSDLARELEIAERRGDQMRVMECRKVTEETQERKRKEQIQAEGGGKAAKLKAMEERARKLWGQPGADLDAAFNGLFADLENNDPDIRAEASRILAEDAVQRVTAVYQECPDSDPRRASLAGRVLGRRAAKGLDDMVPTEIGQMLYGVSASFVTCSCAHCGHPNRGIAAPPGGPMVPYYSRSDDTGAYAVPVLCDECAKEFFVVWDTDPR
jgi:tetratricopeptide (TPR) repeat protein